ncbi:hypothetical protein Pcinc_022859 [Petrolisthes cinctipes]|uniref:Reverse transcriptase n=1 Tax=Petrolisthes cinctipes TaxID=88211 RepID=A0AAE1FD34_PETCI|nr:hypothetical protein Pcinc_022859 [Petrolisthes cinctipes]
MYQYETFNGVIVQEDISIPISVPDDTPTEEEITTIEFDEDVIQQHLDKLDASKVPGPDGVSPFVLNTCASLLHRPLTRIFQSSMDTGEVPADWRRANITPIYKKGSKTQPLNYRPVSLTISSVVSKNLGTNYQLNDTVLAKSTVETDLGVYISVDLKPSTHTSKVTAKANSRLGIIKRSFTFLNKEILRSLYLALVIQACEKLHEDWVYERHVMIAKRRKRSCYYKGQPWEIILGTCKSKNNRNTTGKEGYDSQSVFSLEKVSYIPHNKSSHRKWTAAE